MNIKKILKRNRKEKAFSLLEVIVTLAIFGVIMAVMFSGYPRMNAQINFQKAVSEFLSVYRTAQVFGASRGGEFRGDGVYIQVERTNTSYFNQFLEFTDAENPTLPKLNGVTQSNRYYNPYVISGSPKDLVTKRNTLPKNVFITDICFKDSNTQKLCAMRNISVVFIRPNQEAHISDNNTADPAAPLFKKEYDKAYIQIESTLLPAPKNVKCLIISKVGQIDIQDKACNDPTI